MKWMIHYSLRQFLIAVILIIHQNSFGQTNYLTYYSNTNKAERSICSSDFVSANKYYLEAFEVSPGKCFFIDLLNAFYAGMDSKDYVLAQKHFSELQRKGIDTLILKKIAQHYPADELKNINMEGSVSNTPSLYDVASIENIKKLVKWDQDVRAYYSNLNNGDYMVDSVYKVDAATASSLLKIFQKYGLPDERLWNETKCNIIIHHNTSRTFAGNPSHIFDTILFKAVQTLDYDARLFASFIEQNNAGNTFTYRDVTLNFPLLLSCASFNGMLYPEYYNDSSEKRIDLERAKIGLEPLADFRTKVELHAAARKSNSLLAKYTLYNYINTYEAESGDPESETKFKEWMLINGKDAPVKKPLPKQEIQDTFDISTIANFTIGKTTLDELITFYKTFDTEYYQEKTPYMNRKDRSKKLNWNYHTEFVANTSENLCSDTERNNAALFLEGYKLMGIGLRNGNWRYDFYNIEILFYDQLMIHFSAQMKASFYATLLRLLGPASSVKVTIRKEKLNPHMKGQILLKTKKIAWVRKNLNAEISLTDFLDSSGKTRTQYMYNLSQTNAYNAYLQKTAIKRDSLERLCEKKSTRSPGNKNVPPASK